MENQRIQMFQRLANKIGEVQDVFQVYTDDEFVEKYQPQNRKNEPRKDYFHILIPGTQKNLIEIYSKKGINCFKTFEEYLNVPSSVDFYLGPKKEKESKYSLRINEEDNDELNKKSFIFLIDLLTYSIQLHPEYDPQNKWDLVLKKLLDFSNM